MNTYKQLNVLQHIEEIINNSRSGEEHFFTDCQKAAKDILQFLESENLVVENNMAIEIEYNERSEAA